MYHLSDHKIYLPDISPDHVIYLPDISPDHDIDLLDVSPDHGMVRSDFGEVCVIRFWEHV